MIPPQSSCDYTLTFSWYTWQSILNAIVVELNLLKRFEETPSLVVYRDDLHQARKKITEELGIYTVREI